MPLARTPLSGGAQAKNVLHAAPEERPLGLSPLSAPLRRSAGLPTSCRPARACAACSAASPSWQGEPPPGCKRHVETGWGLPVGAAVQPACLPACLPLLLSPPCRFTVPLYFGRGLLLPWGFLPYPVPLDIVVGAPLAVPKFEGMNHRACSSFGGTLLQRHASCLTPTRGTRRPLASCAPRCILAPFCACRRGALGRV